MKLRASLAAVVALVLVAVAPEANGKGGTLINSCGQTVTTNAILFQDLVCHGSGIVVGAPGIKIDLNGNRLRGDGDLGDYGVEIGAYGSVTVTNGALRNFDVGVFATSADQVSVSKVIASGNRVGALLVGDSASVSSSTLSGNTESDLNIPGNRASVTSVIADGNPVYGITVEGNGSKVTSVSASGNGYIGIHVTGNSASVKASTAVSNDNWGILIEGDAVQLTGNRAEANGLAVHDLNGLGIWVVFTALPPSGKKNIGRGNDDPGECNPAYLC
jgi:hypothetical protein